MSMIDRSLDGVAYLSGQLGCFLKRRLREVGGLFLIGVALLAALALATWSVKDPSLGHATDARVHNLLGVPGAIGADLMMQLLGLGSLALLLPIAIWGYRLLGHRPLSREKLRLLLWIAAAVLSAAFASCLPRSAHWPLPCGLGGVVGDAILRLPAVMFHAPLTGSYRFAAAILLGIGALITFAGAAGILWREAANDADDEEEEEEDEPEDEDEERDGKSGWLSLGGLMHTVISLRARLARLLQQRAATPAKRSDVAMPRRRIEPRFDNAASRADQAEQYVDEPDAELVPDGEARAARKPRAAKPRRSSNGYVLPPLELLALPGKTGRTTVSQDMLQENA